MKVYLYALIIFTFAASSCVSGLPPHIAARFGQASATPTPTTLVGMNDDSSEDAEGVAAAQDKYAESSQVTSPGGDLLAPNKASDVEISPPAIPIEQAEGQLNLLILGSDQRPGDGGFRTDVILLLTINPENGNVALTSFPRDLYVYQPGFNLDRINTAYAHGEFELIADTFEYNFGVRPDHWVLVNFEGFRDIVSALGGIEVEVKHPLVDQRDGYGEYSVEAGNILMDAETALWYVRSRGSTDDFDRTRRQQEVLQAIFFRSVSLNMLEKAPQVYDAYKKMVQTDLSLADLMPLLSVPMKVKNGDVRGNFIGPLQVSPHITSTGAFVLLPNQDEVRQVLLEALSVSDNQN